jgi:hypothetical protein
MHEEHLCAGHPRQRFDVTEDGLVRGSVLKRDENVVVHVKNDEARMSNVETKIEAQMTK